MAYGHQGKRAYGAGDVALALESFEKSLAVRGQLGMRETGLLKALNNVAVAQARTGDMDSAGATFERIAKIARANRPTYDKRLIASVAALFELSRTLVYIGEVDTAESILKQALEIEARERGEDTELAAEILGGLASTSPTYARTTRLQTARSACISRSPRALEPPTPR